MMSYNAAWKVLGIEPCDDERAVKRAYAAKLKAIDPDKDIAGFTRLREAMETARSDARYRKQRAEEPERFAHEDDDFSDGPDLAFAVPEGDEGGDTFFTATGESFAEKQIDLREVGSEGFDRDADDTFEVDDEFAEAPEPDPLNEHYQSLVNALQKTPFISKHNRQACEAVRAILADERMEQIEFSQNVEAWLAQVLADFVPKSDDAILIANAHFNWREEPEQANPRWHVLDVGQRVFDLDCIAALKEPEHHWHDAYAALNTGFPKAFPISERARLQPKVVELVRSLRQFNPGVEDGLRPEVVDAWMELGHVGLAPELLKSEGISWFSWIIFAIIVMQIGRSLFIGIAGV